MGGADPNTQTGCYRPEPMADFPCLEVMTPGMHGWEVGTRVPLTTLPFVLGRSREANLVLMHRSLAQRHCEVVRELDRWWVRDLGSTNGTAAGGERVNDAELEDGDCFELGEAVVLRLLLREPTEVRDEGMERALAEQPDDTERWSVYADWLQERGAPLGLRLSSPDSGEDARWLGPLAGQVARGELELGWAHGLPAHAVLRNVSGLHAELGWADRLALLVRTPGFRFLRSLELDVGSFQRESLRDEWAARALEVLGTSLPMLERLEIGPGSPPAEVAASRAGLAARPGLKTTAASLFRAWQPATLTRGDRVHALTPGAPVRLRVVLPASSASTLSFAFAEDRWRVEVEGQGGLTVNGGPARSAALLRPGDRLSVAGGEVMLFSA